MWKLIMSLERITAFCHNQCIIASLFFISFNILPLTNPQCKQPSAGVMEEAKRKHNNLLLVLRPSSNISDLQQAARHREFLTPLPSAGTDQSSVASHKITESSRLEQHWQHLVQPSTHACDKSRLCLSTLFFNTSRDGDYHPPGHPVSMPRHSFWE